jgi:hypothetical protein
MQKTKNRCRGKKPLYVTYFFILDLSLYPIWFCRAVSAMLKAFWLVFAIKLAFSLFARLFASPVMPAE